MKPDASQNQSNFELPKPQLSGDRPSMPVGPELQGAVSPQEHAPTTPQAAPPMGMPAQQSAQQPVSPTPQPASRTLTDDLTADDADLIEKEWITKAKRIVDETRNDPRQQRKQIKKVKDDYRKKRYNKDLKVKED